MEYRSPLGYNFKLSESVTKQEGKRNNSGGNLLPNRVSFDGDDSSRKQFPFENQKQVNRNSYADRSPNFGSDRKNKWNSSGSKNQQRQNTCSVSISDYYHPSMVEDPWKEFEEKFDGIQDFDEKVFYFFKPIGNKMTKVPLKKGKLEELPVMGSRMLANPKYPF